MSACECVLQRDRDLTEHIHHSHNQYTQKGGHFTFRLPVWYCVDNDEASEGKPNAKDQLANFLGRSSAKGYFLNMYGQLPASKVQMKAETGRQGSFWQSGSEYWELCEAPLVLQNWTQRNTLRTLKASMRQWFFSILPFYLRQRSRNIPIVLSTQQAHIQAHYMWTQIRYES